MSIADVRAGDSCGSGSARAQVRRPRTGQRQECASRAGRAAAGGALIYPKNNSAAPQCKGTASPAASWNVQVEVTPPVTWLSVLAVDGGNSMPS